MTSAGSVINAGFTRKDKTIQYKGDLQLLCFAAKLILHFIFGLLPCSTVRFKALYFSGMIPIEELGLAAK